MENFPQIVYFRITSRCNNDCKYCYGPKKVRALSFQRLKKIFDLFSKNKVKGVVLTGGEPLIHKDITKIFRVLKKHHFKIFLDTNGDWFFKYQKEIQENVNVLGLPLDFASDISYRHKNHFRKIKTILDGYKKTKGKPLLRIGTVVTKDNFQELSKIADFLKNYKIDLWKIYQFIPIGLNATKNQKALEIRENIFEKVTSEIKEKYSAYFKITISRRKDRSDAYFMINPNGQVIMPTDDGRICREIIAGSIFDKDIVTKWKKLVYVRKYMDNAEPTFKFRYSVYPMDQKYNRLWQIAKSYYRKGQFYNLDHIDWEIKEALMLCKKENLDDSIFLPLIILHDIGYIKVPRENPFNQKTRIIHMQAGGEITKRILQRIGYPSDKIEKISFYVAIHDFWSLGYYWPYKKDLYLGMFNDLDYISMITPKGFSAMQKILTKNNQEMFDYLKDNEKLISRPFVNKTARALFKDYLLERRQELNL